MSKRRSRDEWDALLKAQEESGQSVPVFCVAQGLSEASFYYQRQRQRKKALGAAFVPVRVKGSSSTVTIRRGGVSIQCEGEVSVGWLAELVRELSG